MRIKATPHLQWRGPDLEMRMARAAGRSIVSIGEHVAVEGKRNAHVVSGTLRRSIHAAPPGYEGSGDENAARSADLLDGQASVTPTFLGGAATIEVGSWLPYACVEEVGRGHQFMTPAVESVRGAQADAIVVTAVRAEGL